MKIIGVTYLEKKKKNYRKKNKKKTNVFDYSQDIIGIVMLVLSLIYILSLFNVNMGLVGSLMKTLSFSLMGLGAYTFPLLLLIIGLSFVLPKLKGKHKKIIICTSLIFLSLLIIFDEIGRAHV